MTVSTYNTVQTVIKDKAISSMLNNLVNLDYCIIFRAVKIRQTSELEYIYI